ncbi:hypothetical protein Gotri_020125 [Gossypium trilobum]|uniref:Uncharacterized protein n=1 Tax=Gossypium trilobum TaxID=34281 RepID=A0A7J9D8D4_9ROSI|nr:hypothetical protein [Gossypium trilobum]
MVKRSSMLSSLLKVAPKLLRLLAPTKTLFVAPLDPSAVTLVVVEVMAVVMVEGEGEVAMVEVAVDVISVVRWAI